MNDRTAELTLERLGALLEGNLEDQWSASPEIQDELREPWDHLHYLAKGGIGERRQEGKRLEDAGGSEDRIKKDYTGRYPIELLQNAQDACADGGVKGRVWFAVSDSALLVGNEGQHFDRERVSALLRLGGSSKDPGDVTHHTIGYKGIGFSSVLEITDSPQIISKGIAFGFDRELALEYVQQVLDVKVKRVPSRYFPLPIEESAWADDADLVDELRGKGAATVVRLPFRLGVDAERVNTDVRRAIVRSTLILMPALDALEIVGADSWTIRSGKNLSGGIVKHVRSGHGRTESWFVREERIPVPISAIAKLEDELWEGVHDLHVLVAFPWSDGRPNPDFDSLPIHSYFPTEDQTGRAILLHGDFFLESNRKHIPSEGPSGELNGVVTEGLVELVAQVASDLVDDRPEVGEAVVRCLAPLHGSAEGFGSKFVARLDSELAQWPILRGCDGNLLAPERAEILGVDLAGQRGSDFVAMLTDRQDLVDPRVENGLSDWIESLGADVLAEGQVARRIDTSRAPSYVRGVLAVSEWWDGRSRRFSTALQQLPLMQSIDGDWCTSDELCIPVDGIPGLPKGLTRRAYLPPKSTEAREFIARHFEIDSLTADRALEILIEAIEVEDFGLEADESRSAHDFARALFRIDPSLIAKNEEIGAIPVPARLWRKGTAQEWSRADKVYFSGEWTGNNDLERLFGPFSEREFLDVPVPATKASARQGRRFYEALGVASAPRTNSVNLYVAPTEWRLLDEVQAALVCPQGHPRSGLHVNGHVIERLEQVLVGLDARRATALVSVLSVMKEPYGGDVTIKCGNKEHRRAAATRVIGIQRWLLENSDWILVEGDPLGRELVPALDAWTHVNSDLLRSCVGVARVQDSQAAALDLPRMTDPSIEALVRALEVLHEAFAELDRAPTDVKEGSLTLLDKLDSKLKRRRSEYPGAVPMMPATKDGVFKWEESPIVSDLPVPDGLGLSLLPSGKWEGLIGAFDLQLASDTVEFDAVIDGARRASVRNLDMNSRAVLAALIVDEYGVDLRRTVRRLGLLQISEVAGITIRWRSGKSRVSTTVDVYLSAADQTKDAAMLYSTIPIDDQRIVRIAEELAIHLELPDFKTVLLFMNGGPDLARSLGVTDTAIQEARTAMTRYLREDEADVEAPHRSSQTLDDLLDDEESSTGVFDLPRLQTAEAREEAQSDVVEKHASPVTWSVGRMVDSAAADGFTEESEGFEYEDVSFTPAPERHASRQKVLRTAGPAGSTGEAPAPTRTLADRYKAEVGAIDVARKFAKKELGVVEVRDVQRDNKGWDLEFVFDKDNWWPVEVKGFSEGIGTLLLTRNEMDAARTRADYRVILVSGVASGSGRLFMLRLLHEWLGDAEVVPMSWSVQGWPDSAVEDDQDWSGTGS